MIRRTVLSLIVAIVVSLVCWLLGTLLISINVAAATIIGGFFVKFSYAIGILSGLWYFFTNGTWRL